MIAAYLSAVLLIGWFGTPAISAPGGVIWKSQIPIENLVASKPAPDYDAEVLVPLRQAQKVAAEATARQAAAQAEQQREQEALLERQREVQAAQVSIVPATGDCSTWMSQAGITDTANAYKLIMRESGCNPNAVNRSSGACGIGQQLPCGKWPHVWNDPVGGMIDMQSYVYSRYGTWANAWAHETGYGWY